MLLTFLGSLVMTLLKYSNERVCMGGRSPAVKKSYFGLGETPFSRYRSSLLFKHSLCIRVLTISGSSWKFPHETNGRIPAWPNNFLSFWKLPKIIVHTYCTESSPQNIVIFNTFTYHGPTWLRKFVQKYPISNQVEFRSNLFSFLHLQENHIK